MKNVVTVVLVVVVVLLGILLYQSRSARLAFPFAKMAGIPGATHHREDHHKPARTVETEDCARTGKDGKTCVILISYLNDMVNNGKDTAIEVYRNDTIMWVGDGGETIAVQPPSGVLCSDHTKPDPSGGSPFIGPISGTGNIQIAQVTNDSTNDYYCYKGNIQVTPPPSSGKPPYTIDPHMFGEGAGP
jgi:hypothetical protein